MELKNPDDSIVFSRCRQLTANSLMVDKYNTSPNFEK